MDVRRSTPQELTDFHNWCSTIAKYDALKIFVYLHEHQAKVCCWDFVNKVIEHKATKVLQWMVEGGCRAVRLGAIGYAAGDPKQDPCPRPYNQNKQKHEWHPRNPEAAAYLQKHIRTLKRNQKLTMCGNRFYVPHYDWYAVGVQG